MRRPVVKEDIVRYMRTHQKQNEGYLAELEAFAHQENIPIIQHEVVAYFRFFDANIAAKKYFRDWHSYRIFSTFNGRKCPRCEDYDT